MRTKGARRPAPGPRSVTVQPGSTTAPGRGSSSSTISSTVTTERPDASTASRCTPVIPHSWTFPVRSARWAWMTATSGRRAATAVSVSPVNGQVIGLMVGRCSVAAAERLKPGAVVTAEHGEREPGGAGHVAIGHPGVAMFFDLQRDRPGVLNRVTEPVERADARVAAPREDQLAHAARADELVVDQVRRHPDERQVAAPLPDELVPGGERDQVGEPLHRHGVAITDRPLHGFGE